ncbi:HlyD family type I secretion periplasmic adaptor subunit [Pseudohaliea rubra]|uniref:Membrane fusion protein (MFP) family protein n=1 Tax=Pseudohaliea rubra DSM 19751 TaxID=1265313 RepID=A0A095VPV8_9GAMM|nr:HlyD family type I secretion periplasmic adaptor subunit [Pseudohaliea rubra]KGE03123.1 HlyD family secretion protein [Pseudohaliea rubra DSM 19751]
MSDGEPRDVDQNTPPPAPMPTADAGKPHRSGAGRRFVDRLFAPWMREVEADAINWQQDAHQARIEQNPLRARTLLYAVAVTVIALVIWAAFAEIDEVTRGSGKVIPARQVQVIQSQDGGVIRAINIREGQVVREGDLLVRLDQTRSRSTLRENLAEAQGLRVKALRLQALIDEGPFNPGLDLIEAVPEIVEEERELYESSRAQLGLQQQIAREQLTQRREELSEVTAREGQMARSLALSQQELDVTRPMVASGAVSEVEILRLEREVNQLSGERDQARAQMKRIEAAINEAERKLEEVTVEFRNVAREDLTETLSRINALKQTRSGLSDRVDQTAVRSPVDGTIKQLYYNTIGGVVMPGKEIVEIVPLDDTLLVEVRIQPRDIAFLIPGQEALVKFSAYDFVVYGGLDGEVEHIGADTVLDEDGNPFYKVNVRTQEASLGKDKPIIPGMTAEVDILTGKKTVLAYLMKPVLRAKQYALSER